MSCGVSLSSERVFRRVGCAAGAAAVFHGDRTILTDSVLADAKSICWGVVSLHQGARSHCSPFSQARSGRQVYQSHPNYGQIHNGTSRLHCPKGGMGVVLTTLVSVTQEICRWNFCSILVTVFRGWHKSTMMRRRRLNRAATDPGSWYNSTEQLYSIIAWYLWAPAVC